MRRILLPLATLLALTPHVHASQIDDFTLTSAHHTFTWSLNSVISNYNPFPNQFPSITFWTATALVTEDGVTTSLDGLTFYKRISPMSGFQFSNYILYGANVSIPDPNDPTSATYATGTIFSFRDAPNNGSHPNQITDGPYTLTITPEAATLTPEPASLALLATGALGLLPTLRRRP